MYWSIVRADALADTALRALTRPYPFHLQHMLLGPQDVADAERLHPVFHGSYDWHSSVHMHATLARLLRWFPGRPWEEAAHAHLAQRFTAARVAGERAYMAAPERRTFERPYGWAWLLRLQSELDCLARERSELAHWAHTLLPLTGDVLQRWLAFLPRQAWPVRTGVHGNSAFAAILALDYAEHAQRQAFREALTSRAHEWYGADVRYPASYEPSGEDFLSPGLCEALLMARTLGQGFPAFWQGFAPEPHALVRWLEPVSVSDPTDARIVHLHGLNLSRAWCWRGLLPCLPSPVQDDVRRAIDTHLHVSIDAATDGDYGATHWLASFVLLALGDARPDLERPHVPNT